MNSDQYLKSVLSRYTTTLALFLPLSPAYQAIVPILQNWGSTFINGIEVSGSNAKGTAIKGVADLDLFVSLHPTVLNSYTLAQLYNSLSQYLQSARYTVRRQNVSVHITHNGVEVDVVPAVKFAGNTNDHWLYVTKSGRDRTKTNVDTHIRRVLSSQRTDEIRLTKIWRKIYNLEFPSIYLEEAVIGCLSGCRIGNLEANFWSVLGYLATNFSNTRILDPANSSNIISDDLTKAEKTNIQNAALTSRQQKIWRNVVW